MSELTSRKIFVTIILLGVLAMLGPVGHDIFIPSIPNIAEGLNTATNQVSISISAIFLGNAIGTLFHGPLADRFGRKIIILWVLGIYAITALVAAFSPNVETLIMFRFFQGLALSGGRVLSATVARDLFEKEKLGKVMSDIMFITAISAVIAPLIGGYTAKYLPWQSSLLFMAIFAGLVFLLFLTVFKEPSKSERKKNLKLSVLLRDLITITSNRSFLLYSLTGGLMLASLVVFLSISANIIIGSYGFDPNIYGFMFASVSLVFLFGTFVGGRLVTKLGLNRMIKWGVLFGVLGGGLMLLLALLELRTPYAIILPMWVFIFGLAFVNPNSVASALQPFPGIAGSASSITNFIRGIFGAAVSFGISFFNHDDALVLATTIFILCCLATLSICTKTYKQ